MLEQGEAIYFDGQSNRKRKAVIRFGPALEIVADGVMAAAWPYGDVRRVDSAPDVLRLMCASAPALARIEIQDEALKQAVAARCPALEGTNSGKSQTWRIVAYSAA